MCERMGVALAALLSAAGVSGCMTHNCDPSTTTLDADAGVLTPTNDGFAFWSSSPLEGPWLPFNGNETIQVTLPTGYVVAEPPSYWVGTSANPGPGGGTWTTASGQLGEGSNLVVTDGGFDLNSGDCTNYYVYVTVPLVKQASGDAGIAQPVVNDAGADATTAASMTKDAGRDGP